MGLTNKFRVYITLQISRAVGNNSKRGSVPFPDVIYFIKYNLFQLSFIVIYGCYKFSYIDFYRHGS